MESNQSTRKRFHKPWHFFRLACKRPFRGLREVFQNYHLDDLKQEILHWQQLALCNDQSAYDEGCIREDLMDFIQELQRLMEAFHILNETKNRHRKRKQLKGLSKQSRQTLTRMNIPVLLTDEEMKSPKNVINQFCITFRRSYAQMELLDLLDAAITYEGDKKVYKGQLVLFYEHLYFLIRLAYTMRQREASTHKKRKRNFI